MNEKKDTLYFVFKLDIGNASPEKAKEAVTIVSRMISEKQRPDDMYAEKWYVLPVQDEGTSIELIYPPSEEAKAHLAERYTQLIAGMDDTDEYPDTDDQYRELPLSKEELTRRYLSKVEQIATDLDWKTHFGPEEICDLIYDILKDEIDVAGENFYPIIYCGIKNTNGRVYEIEEIEKHMPELTKMSESRTMIGQIDYPINELTNTIEAVNLRNASHVVTSISLYDGILWGRIECLDTEPGRILKSMMDNKLVVFRPVVEGTTEKIGDTDYTRIKKFIGIHAVSVENDSFKLTDVPTWIYPSTDV